MRLRADHLWLAAALVAASTPALVASGAAADAVPDGLSLAVCRAPAPPSPARPSASAPTP